MPVTHTVLSLSLSLSLTHTHTHTQSRESSEHIQMRRVQRAQLQHATHTHIRDSEKACLQPLELLRCRWTGARRQWQRKASSSRPRLVLLTVERKCFCRIHSREITRISSRMARYIHAYIHIEGQGRGAKRKINQFAALERLQVLNSRNSSTFSYVSP